VEVIFRLKDRVAHDSWGGTQKIKDEQVDNVYEDAETFEQ